MDQAAFNLALKTRAYADTGAGGLRNATTPLITGWFPSRPDSTIAFPYVVTTIAAAESDHAQQLDVGRCMVYMHVWHEKEGSDDIAAYTTVGNICKRIYGNWASATPTVAPTYGFHRHPLSIATGTWRVAGQMECKRVLPLELHEARYFHSVVPFLFFLNQ